MLVIAEPEREAWVLAGFEPADDAEQRALQSCRAELGFQPHLDAHLLSSGRDTAKTDSKRVLALLCSNRERERECLRIGDKQRRALLIERGARSGLRSFITEVEERLLAQVDPAIKARWHGERP